MRPSGPSRCGVVRARGEETTNAKLAAGRIEVDDRRGAPNTSMTPPFQIGDGIETSEDTRLRYRYLDIRHSRDDSKPYACSTTPSPSARRF